MVALNGLRLLANEAFVNTNLCIMNRFYNSTINNMVNVDFCYKIKFEEMFVLTLQHFI